MPVRKNSHYDTLGLTENCTSQEIKTAYVTLSKRFHPDRNPDDPDHNKKFIKVTEAYSILSKPNERKIYDISLRYNYHDPHLKVKTTATPPVWRDESIWYMRNRRNDPKENGPYYGIPGIKRVSNLWIAGGAMIIMAIGTIFHFIAIRSSSAFTVEQLNLRDKRLSQELRNARSSATRNGNDLQLEILQVKLDAIKEATTANEE